MLAVEAVRQPLQAAIDLIESGRAAMARDQLLDFLNLLAGAELSPPSAHQATHSAPQGAEDR